jgi:hypothetical protein
MVGILVRIYLAGVAGIMSGDGGRTLGGRDCINSMSEEPGMSDRKLERDAKGEARSSRKQHGARARGSPIG